MHSGLLKVLHGYILEQLGMTAEDEDDEEEALRLWTDVLFRDDCTLKSEAGTKPFHHKDLTLFGCHLSRLVMVDNSPAAVAGQEPNVILIKDFFGRDAHDDEVESSP